MCSSTRTATKPWMDPIFLSSIWQILNNSDSLKNEIIFFFYVIWWFSFFAEFLMLRLYLDLSIVFRRTRIKVFMELNKHNYFFFLFSLKIVVHRQSANVICIYVILSFLCIRIHAQIRACCIRCVCRTCLSYIYLNLRVQ